MFSVVFRMNVSQVVEWFMVIRGIKIQVLIFIVSVLVIGMNRFGVGMGSRKVLDSYFSVLCGCMNCGFSVEGSMLMCGRMQSVVVLVIIVIVQVGQMCRKWLNVQLCRLFFLWLYLKYSICVIRQLFRMKKFYIVQVVGL